MWALRERGHRAYAPTFPGHTAGASRRGIRHDDYVTAVSTFVEHLNLRDIVLVGHSFGGSVISRAFQRIPDRIKRLVFHTAFVVEDGVARLKQVEIGHRNSLAAEVLSGLTEGVEVIVHPGDNLRDGAAVRRES